MCSLISGAIFQLERFFSRTAKTLDFKQENRYFICEKYKVIHVRLCRDIKTIASLLSQLMKPNLTSERNSWSYMIVECLFGSALPFLVLCRLAVG